MHLPHITSKIQSEITDVHGYLIVALYIHYFLPGSLKIRTRLHRVYLGQLGELIDQPHVESIDFKTRRVEGKRWLAKSEMPYPGYCRAPGSSQCLDVFCNCKALDEQWRKYINKKKGKGKLSK